MPDEPPIYEASMGIVDYGEKPITVVIAGKSRRDIVCCRPASVEIYENLDRVEASRTISVLKLDSPDEEPEVIAKPRMSGRYSWNRDAGTFAIDGEPADRDWFYASLAAFLYEIEVKQ